MFSKELENLIQATLEDGILEEYEKAALVKRAQAEGVDLTELEIYINSLLQKRQRELNQKKDEQEQKYEKEKKEAFGRTCPNCGKQVPPMTLKCDCGYEFTSAKNVSSVQVLSDKIEAIMSKPYKHSDPDSDKYKEEVRQRYQRVKETINFFPVPNTKEDIIEFLALSASNAKKKGGLYGSTFGRIIIAIVTVVIWITIGTFIEDDKYSEKQLNYYFWTTFLVIPAVIVLFTTGRDMIRRNELAEAWRLKFDQVIIKGRSLRGDAEFTQQLDYYENLLKK